jgi:predicted GIY-YIG superfamily endonuclease
MLFKPLGLNKMSCNVYVLALEGGRYYIGRTKEVLSSSPNGDGQFRRFEQHLNGNGSAWTKKYKPIAIEKTLENVSIFEEDKVTKEYMDKYGIDMVRGGSYVQIELNEIQKRTLKAEMWAAKDLCNRCGRGSHFVKNCYAKTDVSGNLLAGKGDVVKEELKEEVKKTDENEKDVVEEGCFPCGVFSRFFGKQKYSFESPSSSNLLEMR